MVDEAAGSFTFPEQLDELKRRGCALLLVTEPDGEPVACDRLLGHDVHQRRRLFVPTTVPVATVLDRCGRTEPDASNLGVVDVTTTARSVAAQGPVTDGPDLDDSWYDSVDDLRALDRIAAKAFDHVSRFERTDPDPGEIRLCLESLDPFVDCVSDERLFAFVHQLLGAVRTALGMSHVHVSAAFPAETRRLLRPLFDATVHVRSGEDGQEQRWEVHESGYETEWLPYDRSGNVVR